VSGFARAAAGQAKPASTITIKISRFNTSISQVFAIDQHGRPPPSLSGIQANRLVLSAYLVIVGGSG
jgi:hypothetical protein